MTEGSQTPPPPIESARVSNRTAAYWVSTFVGVAGALARGKILAVLLGTSGVGVVAQLVNIVAVATTIAGLGFAAGGVTLLGRATALGDEDARRRIVSTVLVLPTIAAAVITVVAIGFARPLATSLLGSPHRELYLVLAATAIPANVILSSYQIILQGHGRAWRLAGASAITAVLVLATVAILVIPFGLTGGAVTVVAMAVVSLAVLCVREPWVAREAFPVHLADRAATKILLTFGFASLIAATIGAADDLILRTAVVRQLGTAANGLYQPAYLLGNVFFVQLGSGVAAAITPGLAASWARRDLPATTRQLRSAIRLSLITMVPLILVGMAARSVLVPAVFDSSFSPSEPVLAVQLLSELPRAITYALGSLLLPAGAIRIWLSMGIGAEAVRLSTGLLLLHRYGLQALTVASTLSWSLMAVVTLIVVWRFGVRLGRDIQLLICAAIVAVAGSYITTRLPVNQAIAGAAWAVIAAAWLIMFLTDDERRRALHALANTRTAISTRRRDR
jgi:PST family polysaccharide transporter